MKYRLFYWLPNQSRIFSSPQMYETEDLYSIKQAVAIAKANKYEIVELRRLESNPGIKQHSR